MIGISDSKTGQASVSPIITFVLLVVFLFGFLMINVWGGTIVDEFVPEITTAKGYTNESVDLITQADSNYDSLFDSIGVFVLIGLWILTFVLAYNSSNSPMLGVLAIILVVIVSLVGMILSNAWDDISSESDLSTAAGNMPMLDYILDNFLLFIIVIGMTLVLGFFLGASNT